MSDEQLSNLPPPAAEPDEALEDDLFAALDEIEEESETQAPPSGETRAEDAPLPAPEERAPYLLPTAPDLALTPRAYQQSAVDAWLRADGRGVVVLPTGAGKTIVAYDAIARLGVRALIVVPTIELLRQWRAGIITHLRLPRSSVGAVGGGEHSSGPVTVITYDSAAMKRRRLEGFGLLIFDEVHHLPAQSYRTIVEKAQAPWRLGLSATLERADGRHDDLSALIGPVVFERAAEELSAQKHIAAYKERRIYVDLKPEEELRYETLMAEWRWYLATRRSQLGNGPDMFSAIIRRSAFDAEARSALRAHHEARLVAMNAEAKLAAIEDLLRKHASDKAIVFSEYVGMVERISRQMLIPAITYRTPPAERHAILEGFRSGKITKLVTGRVLNEGVDVPDANVAIVASGSASMREYIQRLGRVLRPKPGEAQLYELISRRTTERNAARRRRPPRKGLVSQD
ncbi:MAG TPA: DEAD/DEAH box helicase family protein [Ktedonobacterales bacterium]|nr:DEAD/DEAH box helicase family protein [Ktedonobacterales bacterium]